MVSSRELLGVLPPFTNSSLLIEGNQNVPDIIREVLEAHKHFAEDYDIIYQYFDKGNIEQICKSLFNFCKRNVRYKIEGENEQTTKSPSALLAMSFGDCKHYAGFIAGVLCAIQRNTGKKINWCYRFASYDMFIKEPGHVFVVVKDRGEEFWIDPVLNDFNESLQPFFFIDKKISMPLYRLSGINSDFLSPPNSVGLIAEVIEEAPAIIESITSLFGGDDVPDYPVKTSGTFNSLKASVIEHVGVVAPKGQFEPGLPSSVAVAQTMLQKAIARQAYEDSIGHGYGDGVGWDTLQMLYDETITSLKAFIDLAGKQTTYPTQTYPTSPGTYPPTTPAPSQNFLTDTSFGGMPNWVWLAAGAGAIYYFSRRRDR